MALKLEDLDVTSVIDRSLAVNPGVIFGQDDRMSNHEILDAHGKLPLDFGGFLIRTGDRRILVDLGYGDGTMLTELERVGESPESITDVIFTHLHIDHIGWASDGHTPTFPNATYRCDEADWEYFVGEQSAFIGHHVNDLSSVRIKQTMRGIGDRVELWTSDCTIAPGVSIRRTPGHTPGSSIVVLSSGSTRAVLLGDVVHCPVELLEDDWHVLVDVDPVMAQSVRESLAREFEDSDVAMGAAHFPGLRFGRLMSGNRSRRWTFDLAS